MFPKVTPAMPKGNWKSSLAFSPTSTVKIPLKELKHYSEDKKPDKTPKPKKPIAKISEKKKKRIKDSKRSGAIDLIYVKSADMYYLIQSHTILITKFPKVDEKNID
jgi:hypothetical protein